MNYLKYSLLLGLLMLSLLSVACNTAESLNLQIGDAFTVDPYQVKLIEIEERPSIIALTDGKIGTVDPMLNKNVWVVLTIEITNLRNEAHPIMLLPTSASIQQAEGQKAKLSSVGVLAPEDNAILLGFIEKQKLTSGFLGTGARGRIFVIPSGTQSLLLVGGVRNIIGDPNSLQWDLGHLAFGETTQISLLFEMPEGEKELTWQFLEATPVGLPESQTPSFSEEHGPSMTLSMTDDELCQIAEPLELECP